jgi:hypothetical protein
MVASAAEVGLASVQSALRERPTSGNAATNGQRINATSQLVPFPFRHDWPFFAAHESRALPICSFQLSRQACLTPQAYQPIRVSRPSFSL